MGAHQKQEQTQEIGPRFCDPSVWTHAPSRLSEANTLSSSPAQLCVEDAALVRNLPHGGGCLKGLNLEIEPEEVERGGKATLLCRYDLEGSHLYAVKWYRGQREFYRYSPNENPATKIFPFGGIHVDLSMSNASQVVLDQVGFNLSGNISCEVTTEAQFSTITISRKLTVIELPKSGPLIQTEKERYDAGDVLRANCSTAPSRPAAQIDFYINNLPAKGGDTSTRDAGNGLWTARRKLEIKLEPSQFRGVPVVVKCEANVSSSRRTAQLSVGPKTTEPVPERVTSPSQSQRILPCYLNLLLLLPFLTS